MFQFFDRNPQLFAPLEASLEELQTMVFDFSQRKKYVLTRHALTELQNILASYLRIRDKSLRVPTSTMALFMPSETTFDGVLSRQLERLKDHAARGIASSDQEFVKQVIDVLAHLSLVSQHSRSYFTEYGENSVTSFVAAYLYGSIRDATARRLDDVGMEGADHLRDLCNVLIKNSLFTSALTQVSNLEQLAVLSVINKSDVVLSVTVRALCECLAVNCFYGYSGSLLTTHLLKGLVRVTRARLASPLGLDMTTVNYSVGPFISVTEKTSFAGITIAMVNRIIELSTSNDWQTLQRLRSTYKELHDHIWLDFAELGIEAVKAKSFLLYYINTTVVESVRANVHLVGQSVPRIEVHDEHTAHEQYSRERFREEIKDTISWQTTGIYSRIIPAMFEHRQLSYLDDTLKSQCLFAFWGMHIAWRRLP
jgi:hypothetical protein